MPHNVAAVIILMLTVHITLADFTVSAQKSSGCFPGVSDYIINTNTRSYTPFTLYDYINGAAEFYLSYDFRELYVAEYSNNNHSSFRVEIYLHETPLAAYGIYSQERPLKGNYLQIGAQGYIELPILNFITGNRYVKIYSYDTDNEDIVMAFASDIAAGLGGYTPLPAVLACFPAAHKIENSERFVNRYFLGYDFLHSGFIADYFTGDNTFQLFIIQASDSGDCHDMLSNYFQLCQMSDSVLIENHCIVIDPYHGKIELRWDSKYIWGTINLDDEDLRSVYLHQIRQGIDSNNR